MMDRRTFMAAIAAASLRPRPSWSQDGFPNLVRFPYIQNTRSDRATIMWATQEPSTSFVEYTIDNVNFGLAPATGRLFPARETGLPRAFTQYRADLSALASNTLYNFRVIVGGDPVAAGRFTTAGPGPFGFLAIGDSGQ